MFQISFTSAASGYPLYSAATTRRIEQLAAAFLPPQTLMKRAGRSLARLTLALAPHARCIWIACGSGNNGGDGFEAALRLHQAGKKVVVTCIGPLNALSLPSDAAAAYARFVGAGLFVTQQPPPDFDFCIDALLGLGASQDTNTHASAAVLECIRLMQSSQAPRLCVDLPSGLDADTGQSAIQTLINRSKAENSLKNMAGTIRKTPELIAHNAHGTGAAAVFTLSFLVLKPGLFTAIGRDCAGEVWLDDLGISDISDISTLASLEISHPHSDESDLSRPGQPAISHPNAPSARLVCSTPDRVGSRNNAAHASHKGSFGDVGVIGGECTASSHMAGAALLAARAALHAGAGRVFVALLSEQEGSAPTVDISQPELMFRKIDALDLEQQVIVCGCGGGQSIHTVLPKVLAQAHRLVLDADALNALAKDAELQALLMSRQHDGKVTVLTPHPLEAARLLNFSTSQVQADRLSAAAQLSIMFGCTIVLKGSGSIIAAPGRTPAVNLSGNALLATAGTGDVLAGMLGACIARGKTGFDAACDAVHQHGKLADDWAINRPDDPFTASDLATFSR